MKTRSTRCILALLAITAGTVFLATAADEHRKKLTRITKKRIPGKIQGTTICVLPPREFHEYTPGFLHLYANEIALAYRRAHPEAYGYPVGSVFLKEKYADKDGKDANLATLMKRVGNQGTVEDWEFSMITLPDRKEVADIRKEMCADCHSKYEKRGFVSRDTESALRQNLKLKPAPPSTNDADEDRSLLHLPLRPDAR